MRFLALVFGFFLSLSGFSQQPGGMNRGGQMPTGRFYGRVVDASNKGIEAASVVLAQDRMDSATKQRKEFIVGGMLTAANGDFSIENVPLMGRYKLRVTGIGYKTLEKQVNFDLPSRGAGSDMNTMLNALDKDLGNIKLEIDDKVLENVTVSASKPLLQMGIDRKVFNVDRNITSAGGTAVDVMRNVPSIAVDVDGNVTLRNNAPQIFVDGRPTNLTLEQIPADAIESIEIITNPSAKFDASGGTAGILNIVLKKQKRVGYAGNLRTNIDSRARVGAGGDINVRQNKINFFASGNVNQRKSIGSGHTERVNLRPRTIKSFQADKSEMEGIFGFGRAGLDYFISNRNTLTLSGTMARGNMNPGNFSEIQTDFGNNGSVDSLQERSANSNNKFRNMGAQMSFKHNFPKAGREWTADVTFNRGRNNNSNIIRTNYFGYPGKIYDRVFQQTQASNGNNQNLVFQTDYSNPINANSKFEVGARAMIRRFENAQHFFASSNNGPEVPQSDLNIIFRSDDHIYATYGTYSNKVKNFGYQLGLRAESSDYKGNLISKNQEFNIEFPISLFPSLFLSQKLTDYDDLQLNYSRRINRPGFWQLFPFYDLSDSLNISRGNPNLKPEFTNSLELSYSKQFKNRDNFIASVYFKNTNNLITRFQVVESIPFYKDSLPVLTFVNANSSYVTGLELISRNKITKFWDLTTNANFFTSKIDLEDAPDPDQFLSYFFKINNTFRLPKNLSFQLSGDYTSKIISSPGGSGGGGRGGFGGGGMFGGMGSAAQGYIRPNYGVDAALRFEFLKNRVASLSLNVNDIFRTKQYSAFTEQPGFFFQDIERRRDQRVFRLNFNYRFGKFDASLFKRRNNRVESEGMDSGIGM